MVGYSRRGFVSNIVPVAVVGITGCTGITGADPEVLDVEATQGFTGAFTSTAKIEVLVKNNGSEGEVQVTVRAENNAGTVVSRSTKTVFMAADERRRVTIRIDASDAERVSATAESA